MSPSFEEWEESLSHELDEPVLDEYKAILQANPAERERLCREYLRRHEKETSDTKSKIAGLLQNIVSQKVQNNAPVPTANNINNAPIHNVNNSNNNNHANNNAPPNVQNLMANVRRVANSPHLTPKPPQPQPQPPAKTWNSATSPDARGQDGPRKLEALPDTLSPADQFARINDEKNEKVKHQLSKQFIAKHSGSEDEKVLEMCKQLSRAETGLAYVKQATGQPHPIYNSQGEHSFKHIDGKSKQGVEKNAADPYKAGIGAYTGEAYKHINPAVAKDDKWMDQAHAPKRPAEPKKPTSNDPAAIEQYERDLHRYQERLERYENNKDEYEEHGRKERIEEGAVHGTFAMEGLKNLPSQAATLYRGERWTPAEFAERYHNKKILDKVNPTSMSTDREVARNFALFGNGNVPAEKSVGVLVIAETFSGKNISGISVNPDEKELLFSAGAKFLLVSLKLRTHQSGNTIIEYYEVHLKQVIPKPRK